MINPFNGNNKHKMEISIPTETFIRGAIVVVATMLMLAGLRKASHAIMMIFVAFFLAIALNAPVSFVARHIPGKARGSRALATTIAALLVLLVLVGFLASTVPPLVRQTQNFINAAPRLVQDVRTQQGTLGNIVRRYHLQTQVDSLSTQLSDRLSNASGQVLNTAQSIGSSFFTILTIIVMTFMMLVEGPRRWQQLHKVLPDRHKSQFQRVAYDMYDVIKGYVNGQVLLAAMAALLISPALFILHISYPVALVFVVFICGLIPMIGHTIGAIIVTLVALAHSPVSAIIILLYYILYQQLENYLIQPRVQANTTNMSPLLVFASVVVGVSFSGLLGGLVAIPVAGCLRIIVIDFLRSRDIIDSAEAAELTNPKEAA